MEEEEGVKEIVNQGSCVISLLQQVTKAVYRGMLELLKLILQQVEQDVVANKEASIFSVFLAFRLALCLCTEAKSRSQTILASPALSPSPSTVGTPTSSSNEASPSLEEITREEESTHSTVNGSLVSPDVTASSKLKPPRSKTERTSPSSSRMVKTVSSPVVVGGGGGGGGGEGKDKEYLYLHKELMKLLGNGRGFMLQRSFWNTLFISVVDTDRGYLGWNEKTAELYNR